MRLNVPANWPNSSWLSAITFTPFSVGDRIGRFFEFQNRTRQRRAEKLANTSPMAIAIRPTTENRLMDLAIV